MAGEDHRAGVGARPDEQPHPRGVRRPGDRLPRRSADRGGAVVGLLGDPDVGRLQRPGDGAADPGGVRGAQEGVSRPADRGAAARVVLPDRAGRGVGRRVDEDAGRTQGRQVGDQWVEVLHHERELRELLHRLREDRPGRRPPRDLVLHRAARRGRDRRQEGGQDGPAGVEHGDRDVPRRRDPARPPDR